MANLRAPKQWQLTKSETITSFESWRQNLMYCLSLDNSFNMFLAEGATWLKKNSTNPLRGLHDDGEDIARANRKTAIQKNTILDLLLGQIANYCPVIARNTIVKGSTSLNDIWQKIRQHYGFQSSGSHFLDLVHIRLETDERPEDLFQRLSAFFEDNLLMQAGSITHHGEQPPIDEDLSPTLENTIVLLWLQLIHPGLPQLVKQKYGAELRNKTLASIKPEISQALSSLLDELRVIEDTKVLRAAAPSGRYPHKYKKNAYKSCVLCKTAGRPGASSHSLAECKFLPEYDRRAFSKSRLVHDVELEVTHEYTDSDQDEPSDTKEHIDNALIDTHFARRVRVIQSPYLNVYYKQHPVRLTIDTGATTNMVRASTAKHIGLPIKPATQLAHQADGVTPLNVVGELHGVVTRGSKSFQLDALVVQNLDVDILAGNPFLVTNDIATRPAKQQIIIAGKDIVHYGPQGTKDATARRTQAYLLRNTDNQTVILPGEFIALRTPCDTDPDSIWALEPRIDAPCMHNIKPAHIWPEPQEVQSIDHSLRLTNTTDEPIMIRRNEQFCQIRPIKVTGNVSGDYTNPSTFSHQTTKSVPPSSTVTVDPDNCLPLHIRQAFISLHHEYESVFNPVISKYNGASGNIEAVVNMGPTLPPQRKGRLPQYSKDKLVQLQCKFDELEKCGVFAKPEAVNVTVEYLNISFLVCKPSGGDRLVTAFGEVGKYTKPQPSLMPNIDSTLRAIASWKYIIVSDLLKSFYQIPLSHDSMKYCGVATPFKGIRVYTHCAMGMPGSETALEESMSRVLGQLVQDGTVAKIADDLYCGGNTPEEVLANWELVLAALHRNNLKLSATKTVVCPKRTTILGWIWSNGTLSASPHKISTLAAVEPPQTVQSLRSFIGAYKVLSRVLKGYADLLHPMEQATAGKQSKDRISWTDELMDAFKSAQAALTNNKVIHLPLPTDTLLIVTDGSVKKTGIGATLYILRNSKMLLAGFLMQNSTNSKLLGYLVELKPSQ